MLTERPLIAPYVQALARAGLLAVGMDHALIDFLTHIAVGAATVMLAILFVAIRIPRRSTHLANLSATEL